MVLSSSNFFFSCLSLAKTLFTRRQKGIHLRITDHSLMKNVIVEELIILVKVMLSFTEHVVSFGELRENGQQIQAITFCEEEF